MKTEKKTVLVAFFLLIMENVPFAVRAEYSSEEYSGG